MTTNNNCLIVLFNPFFYMKEKIFFLHGFGGSNFFKTILSLLLVKMFQVAFKRTKFISNSHLTAAFYRRFLKIKSSVVFFDDIKLNFKITPLEEKGKIIILSGRNVPHKNIIQTLHWLDKVLEKYKSDFKVEVFSDINFKSNFINVVGFVNNIEYKTKLRSSKIFISLCDLEPYGLALSEAIDYNLTVICSKYSGFLETEKAQRCIDLNQLFPINFTYLDLEDKLKNLI